MIVTMLANKIEVDLFIGICDFEYLKKQRVIVNISATGHAPGKPKKIEECLDYSKICFFVKSWESRPHVELVETLLFELFDFLFNQDKNIFEVTAEIIKPTVIEFAKEVGIKSTLSREQFEHEKLNYAK